MKRFITAATAKAVSVVLAGSAMAVDITVDPTTRHQTIHGFGTCLISWDGGMADYYRRPEVVRTYAEDLRFNILRCSLWGDGTIGLTQDPEKISFKDPAFAANDPRTPVFIAFAQAARKINPNLKVIGTVWSPPAWMKENNAIIGGKSNAINGETYVTEKGEVFDRVKPEYYPHFAKWLVEMVKYYESKGVPIHAISPANEPQFTQDFESCVWTADDLATITAMVGERLEKEGMADRVKLFGPETMTGFNWMGGPNRNYTKKLRDNATAFKHLGFFATHGYSDGLNADVSQSSSAQFWDIIKDYGKPFWVTEGGTGGHDLPDALGDKGVAAALHNAFVAGNASAFVPWQFAEDSRSEHNLMPIDGPSKKTHVVRHFSRFIPAGSVRVDALPAYGDVNVSAYLDETSRTVTIVLINAGDSERPVTIAMKGEATNAKSFTTIRTSADEDSKELAPTPVKANAATLTMPPMSIVTLTTGK